MVTKQIAESARYRQEFYHKTIKNVDGSPARCRVNGKCKTWKTRPNEFSLPVKYGLKHCFYINQITGADWEIKS